MLSKPKIQRYFRDGETGDVIVWMDWSNLSNDKVKWVDKLVQALNLTLLPQQFETQNYLLLPG